MLGRYQTHSGNVEGQFVNQRLQSAEDAVLAAEIGLDGVVLSNHGGRYVDNAPSPLQVTAETHAAVGKDFESSLIVGAARVGYCKGACCGANMVMSGRPTLYGVAAAGEAGAYRALEIFYTEMGHNGPARRPRR